MALLKNYTFFVLILFPCSIHVVPALNYAIFTAGNGNFMLRWSYSNNKLIFNMTCNATGWCAVGFTTTSDGGGMVNYDIAAGGVDANGTSYLEDYWSTNRTSPPKDAVNNFELVEAMEMGGYTSVKFERNLTTGEANIDVQFTMNTTVFIVWAMQNMDATSGQSMLAPQHTSSMRGKSSRQYNLITEAMAAAMTSTTVPALNYAIFTAGNGNFMLRWSYSNNKLIFNITCKATGWCAVGFTTTSDGGGMINYDIAAGGVAANGTSYLEDYWSTNRTSPPKDTVNNFELVEAMESGGYTSVKFERNLTTGEANIDVQFMMNTTVFIVWAMQNTDATSGSSTLGPQHGGANSNMRGISAAKHNLITEAMAAAMTPTTTIIMTPSTSVVSTPQPTVDVANYAVFSAGNGTFMLHWTYSNNKLLFNMTCKATGWCAVGFTENPGGRDMIDYDIAAGGVTANTSYLEDYWSNTTSAPPKDAVNNFELVEAMETGGYTSVKFERNLTTGEANLDVQFTMNSEVYIVWAMNSNTDANSASANLGPVHSSRGRSENKQNLIAMAMAAAMTPTTTTMIVPSTSVVSTPQPTGTTVSDGDNFMLTWMYSNNKLMFTMKCKTTGWCAVAFTTGDGRGMKNYDIALGGVASGNNYLDDYWSISTTKPSKDTNNFEIKTATEVGGYTTVQFERDPETSDSANDVQFKPGTEVRIAWAFHSSMDGNMDISKHTSTGVLPDKYTLVPETGSTSTSLTTGITPTTSTMMVSSSSSISTPQSTATTVSFGDKFMLTWIYSNNKLFFILRCKTTGWCAVAFTTGDGSGMKDYDIALGGVASSGTYLDDYWSTSTSKPSKDSANNFVFKAATEDGGYTTVQFERDPETSDTVNDVQFKPGTEVMIAWAMHSSMDGNDDISRHTDKEVLPTKYILVPGAANMLETRVMLSAILAAIVFYLVS